MWWKIGMGIAAVGILGWIGWIVTRPVPGTKMADQGRDHVTVDDVTKFNYNSNPPTSGPHLATWVKAGVYDTAQSEGELIHSLEHGYVIISYNCNVHLGDRKTIRPEDDKRFLTVLQSYRLIVSAHEEDGASPSADFVDPTPLRQGFEGQATGSAMNETDGCKTLVKNLTELANRKKLWKLAVVPRPQLNTTIVLTAWTYLDTFDQFDEKRIVRFIDYHRDQGPEKTME